MSERSERIIRHGGFGSLVHQDVRGLEESALTVVHHMSERSERIIRHGGFGSLVHQDVRGLEESAHTVVHQ